MARMMTIAETFNLGWNIKLQLEIVLWDEFISPVSGNQSFLCLQDPMNVWPRRFDPTQTLYAWILGFNIKWHCFFLLQCFNRLSKFSTYHWEECNPRKEWAWQSKGNRSSHRPPWQSTHFRNPHFLLTRSTAENWFHWTWFLLARC